MLQSIQPVEAVQTGLVGMVMELEHEPGGEDNLRWRAFGPSQIHSLSWYPSQHIHRRVIVREDFAPGFVVDLRVEFVQ